MVALASVALLGCPKGGGELGGESTTSIGDGTADSGGSDEGDPDACELQADTGMIECSE